VGYIRVPIFTGNHKKKKKKKKTIQVLFLCKQLSCSSPTITTPFITSPNEILFTSSFILCLNQYPFILLSIYKCYIQLNCYPKLFLCSWHLKTPFYWSLSVTQFFPLLCILPLKKLVNETSHSES
jgi:hypothetical protein